MSLLYILYTQWYWLIKSYCMDKNKITNELQFLCQQKEHIQSPTATLGLQRSIHISSMQHKINIIQGWFTVCKFWLRFLLLYLSELLLGIVMKVHLRLKIHLKIQLFFKLPTYYEGLHKKRMWHHRLTTLAKHQLYGILIVV